MRKSLKNVVNLDLDLSAVDPTALEELSRLLGELLVERLGRVLAPSVDYQVSVEMEVSDTLDLSVEVFLTSSAPLTPEMLSEVDREIDRAISRFEEIVSLKLGKRAEEKTAKG